MLGVKEIKIIPSNIDEQLPHSLPLGKAVAETALKKADAVKQKVGDSTVIVAADTIVVLDGKVLGKPTDEADAKRMLHSLSGRTHSVYTGLAIIKDGTELKAYESTAISFRQLTDREIEHYIATGEPMDKAGAYAAQGLACLFISHIDGDFFNVVGLPVYLLGTMLKEMGLSFM